MLYLGYVLLILDYDLLRDTSLITRPKGKQHQCQSLLLADDVDLQASAVRDLQKAPRQFAMKVKLSIYRYKNSNMDKRFG